MKITLVYKKGIYKVVMKIPGLDFNVNCRFTSFYKAMKFINSQKGGVINA